MRRTSLAEFLIDSSVLIGRMRRQERAVHWLAALAPSVSFVSALTRTEVIVGIDPEGDTWSRDLVDAFLVLPVERDVADLAGALGWRHRHTHAKKVVDLVIAATAIVHGLVLVTLNSGDFPMPELTLYPLPE